MPMTPDERALARKVDEAIRASGTTDIAVPLLAADIVRNNPTEAAAIHADAAVRFVIGLIERRLKPSNPDAPQLPGFAIPERLPVFTEGGTIWRATVRCTRPEFEGYIEMLEEQIKRDRARLRKIRAEIRRVLELLDRHGVDRLADIPARP